MIWRHWREPETAPSWLTLCVMNVSGFWFLGLPRLSNMHAAFGETGQLGFEFLETFANLIYSWRQFQGHERSNVRIGDSFKESKGHIQTARTCTNKYRCAREGFIWLTESCEPDDALSGSPIFVGECSSMFVFGLWFP